MPAKKEPFDLGKLLSQSVSELDTGSREQIEYISLDLLDSDERNFYELSGIEELAANIELIGLMDPLRVRPAEGGRYTIVSGHRRRAALQLLANEGKTAFAQAPCIRERGEVSSAMQELRLIYANSDTRKLSPADISRTAERVEQLLYKLKDEGTEFPGRMRKQVAQACKVSESKLARLKVIREKLIPEYAKHFQKGDLSESSAYRLAKESENIQRLAWKYDGQCDAEEGRMSYTTEWGIDNAVRRIERVIERKCKHPSGSCTHCETMLGKVFGSKGYSPCEYYCCDACGQLARCKDVCPKMAEKAAKLKLDTKTKRVEERAATKALDQDKAQAISRIWKRFGEARAAAAVSVDECFDRMDIKYASISREKYPAFESLEEKITSKTDLPFGFALSLEHIRRLTNLADLLGVSLDYLLCRTDEPQTAPEPYTSSLWRPLTLLNMPEIGQRVVIAGMCDGEPVYSAREWRQPNAFEQEVYRFWLPLPELPEAER